MATISLDLTIPAGTTYPTAAPIEKKAYIGPCKIEEIWLQFPSGCQYTAKVNVSVSTQNSSKQLILPRIQTGDSLGYIALDNAYTPFSVDVDVESPAILYADGWNDDGANQHEIKVVVILAERD